jgi:RNA polymerase-binding protein DksA
MTMPGTAGKKPAPRRNTGASARTRGAAGASSRSRNAQKAGAKAAGSKQATSKAAPKKAAPKKAAAKAVAKKTAAKRPAAKKTAGRGGPATKPAAKKATPKKAVPKKTPAKAAPKKAPPTKAPAKAVASKKAPPTKTPAKGGPLTTAATARGRSNKKTVICPLSGFEVTPGPANLGAKTLERLRQKLIDEKQRLRHQADDLSAEAEALAREREAGDTQFDEESGEGDTVNIERERDLLLSATARQVMQEIDDALERIKRNKYGVCKPAGRKIALERLEAIPWAQVCVDCKARAERRR